MNPVTTDTPQFDVDPLTSIMLPCPECGYDLRAAAGERCPECRWVIDHEGLRKSQLPWGVRESIGRVRAYWKTLLLVTLNSKRLTLEVSHPVDYRDARRFAAITSALIAIPLVTMLSLSLAQHGTDGLIVLAAAPFQLSTFPGMTIRNPGRITDLTLPWVVGLRVPGVIQLSLMLACAMIPGIVSYWFHPRALPIVRQNRAVALSYYITAPLVWSALAGLILFSTGYLDAALKWRLPHLVREFLVGAIVFASSTVLVGGIMVTLVNTLLVLRRTTLCSALRVALAAMGIPVSWLLLFAATAALLPWLVGFFRILIASLG